MIQFVSNFNKSFQYKIVLMYSMLLLVLLLHGCSLLPPVQEMSNARQSLQAAKSAGAEVHDPKAFSEAQRLLDQASEKIDSGDYEQARELAIRARSIAIKSCQVSVVKDE